jgi:hypothetical protein
MYDILYDIRRFVKPGRPRGHRGPLRLDGVPKVLHATWKMAKPGPVSVTFGPRMRLTGNDCPALAKQVEEAVQALGD